MCFTGVYGEQFRITDRGKKLFLEGLSCAKSSADGRKQKGTRRYKQTEEEGSLG